MTSIILRQGTSLFPEDFERSDLLQQKESVPFQLAVEGADSICKMSENLRPGFEPASLLSEAGPKYWRRSLPGTA